MSRSCGRYMFFLDRLRWWVCPRLKRQLFLCQVPIFNHILLPIRVNDFRSHYIDVSVSWAEACSYWIMSYLISITFICSKRIQWIMLNEKPLLLLMYICFLPHKTTTKKLLIISFQSKQNHICTHEVLVFTIWRILFIYYWLYFGLSAQGIWKMPSIMIFISMTLRMTTHEI